MKPAKTVSEYIAQAPLEARAKLKELRAIIEAAAPEARESISYGIAYYSYKGKLIYFGAWKTHIGIYPIAVDDIVLRNQLKKYTAGKGTLRFPLDQKLPAALIKKFVKARVKQNEAAKAKK